MNLHCNWEVTLFQEGFLAKSRLVRTTDVFPDIQIQCFHTFWQSWMHHHSDDREKKSVANMWHSNIQIWQKMNEIKWLIWPNKTCSSGNRTIFVPHCSGRKRRKPKKDLAVYMFCFGVVFPDKSQEIQLLLCMSFNLACLLLVSSPETMICSSSESFWTIWQLFWPRSGGTNYILADLSFLLQKGHSYTFGDTAGKQEYKLLWITQRRSNSHNLFNLILFIQIKNSLVSIQCLVQHFISLSDCSPGYQMTKYNVHLIRLPVKIILMKAEKNAAPIEFSILRSNKMDRAQFCKIEFTIANILQPPEGLFLPHQEDKCKGKHTGKVDFFCDFPFWLVESIDGLSTSLTIWHFCHTLWGGHKHQSEFNLCITLPGLFYLITNKRQVH